MFRNIIITIMLVCSLSLTAFAQPSSFRKNPTSHHQNNKHGKFLINITSSGRGFVSPKGQITVSRGQTVHFSFRPVKGYYVQRVVINGNNVGRVSNYTIRNVNRNYRVHVEFANNSRGSNRQHHR